MIGICMREKGVIGEMGFVWRRRGGYERIA